MKRKDIETARAVVDTFNFQRLTGDLLVSRIANAIAAEREACASVADDHRTARRPYDSGEDMAEAIADSIRARAKP